MKLYEAIHARIKQGKLQVFEDGRILGERGQKIGSVQEEGGYVKVGIPDPQRGRSHTHGAQRIVWMALVGDVPDGYEINHINHDKSDNRLENLECITAAENMQHTAKMGRGGGGRGVTRKPTVNSLLQQSSEYQEMICELWELVVEYHRGGRLSGEDFNKLSQRVSNMQQDFTIEI